MIDKSAGSFEMSLLARPHLSPDAIVCVGGVAEGAIYLASRRASRAIFSHTRSYPGLPTSDRMEWDFK